ncbi:MAG TPA: glycosyl hydrolase family protein, partial [Solirubrobacteraceae bacterium]
MPIGVLIALLVLVGSVAAPAQARSLQVGMADDGALRGVGADDTVAAWQRMGVDAARLQVSWARVSPSSREPVIPATFQPANPDDPGYDWSVIDEEVGRLVGAGIRPILMIDGPAPLWASSQPALGNQRYRPVGAQYAAFASAVAQRYGRDVQEYILWNEPNLPLWLQPQATCVKRVCTPASADAYRQLVRAAYPAIHAADPDAKVLIGALAPRGSRLRSRNANMRPLQFLRALGCVDERLRPLRAARCAHFQPAIADGFAYHPHSTRLPPDEPYDNPDDADLASLPRLERLLDRLQATGRLVGTTRPLGLWLDEYGYQTDPPDGTRGVTPGQQDRYLQQAAYLAWRDPRVQLITQYAWQDETVGGGRAYTGWQSGLIDTGGNAKPSLGHLADPIWADFARRTLWGQVRPGGAHDVEVRFRPAGARTTWRTLARVRTRPDGTWSLQRTLAPFGSYRAVADGETSATIVATPLSLSSFTPAADPTGPIVARTVGTRPGARIPPSFAGLSVEYGSVPAYLGTAGRPNRIFARLMTTLRRAARSAPTLRLGGDSSEQTWWNPAGAPRPAGITTDITPAWISQLRAWEKLTRTPLVLGMNLALDDPANAADFARAALAGLPARSVTTFEIGHEPDRAPAYDHAKYLSGLDRYVSALRPASGGIALSGAAFAAPAWDDRAGDLLIHERGNVRVYSAQGYPLQTCDPKRRRRDASRLIRRLLSNELYAPTIARAAQLVAAAATRGAAVRYAELNSAVCGGLLGVSDSFASALWGTDVLFGLADAGVRNANLHTWTGSHGAPVDFALAGGRVVGRVRPLFYAMLLFDRAAPSGSRLLPVGPRAAGSPLKTWATIDAAGTRRIVVINKDLRATSDVVLRVKGAARAAVERLTAPSLRSTSNVTLAGQSYGNATRDGLLRGRRRFEALVPRRGALRVRMPPA